MSARLLVAGVGNIFFGDDGFGPEVLRRLLAARSLDDLDVKVEDFGIRGLHLAYELLCGYERAILIDAVSRGATPGTISVIEPDPNVVGGDPDAHRMDLRSVFGFVRLLEGKPPPLLLVGCEPATVDDGIGLSPAVNAALEPALRTVERLAREFFSPSHAHAKETTWSEV
ncbi:MAG: hydrogenase maturation protease [Vulcanimicrobiaceae bacterium]